MRYAEGLQWLTTKKQTIADKEERVNTQTAKKDQAPPGIDPGTCALQVHRSTTEPQSRLRQKFVELLLYQARVCCALVKPSQGTKEKKLGVGVMRKKADGREQGEEKSLLH